MVNRLLLLSCLLVAAVVRLSWAGREPFTANEAESSINALTILERGYPADRYLGLPIYENVLVTASPDSREYEFRDSIHSDRGIALDHGWLPLYSIAAAYTLAGIRPDVDDGRPPYVRHTSEELTRRTIVPRLPSIAFAVVFVWSIYVLARTISGGETAWSVLLAATFAQPLVLFGFEAGFDSATLALSGLSGLAIWNMTRRGSWRDSVAAGVALMLLFHTHAVSFVILSGVLLSNVPFAKGRQRWMSKLLLSGVIAAAGIVPWLYWTNVFEAARQVPMAWPLLAFPTDFLSWFAARKAFVLAIGLVAAVALGSLAFPRRPFARRIIAAARDSHAFYFALTWFVIAYLAFILLTPAASFSKASLMLVLAVPGYLLFALCVAVAARTMTARFAAGIAPLIVVLFLGARGTVVVTAPRQADPGGVNAFLDVASSWTLEPGTKIYTWPNENLLLTYLSGLPVQSIAPVRKAFLDEFPGDVIFVETGTAYADRVLTDVQSVASRQGVVLSVEAARQAAFRIQRLGARRYLQGLVTDVWPPPESAEPFDAALLAAYTEHTRRAARPSADEYPLLRGFAPPSWLTSDWLPVSYWFVNPEQRLGDQLNYRDRIRRATGIVLPNGSIIFDGRRKRDVPLINRERYVALERGMSAAGS